MAPPANVALLRVKLARADSDMTTCTRDAGVRGACVCVCVCVCERERKGRYMHYATDTLLEKRILD